MIVRGDGEGLRHVMLPQGGIFGAEGGPGECLVRQALERAFDVHHGYLVMF